jgi:serine/threonine protein phosphatase PrpC
MIVVDVRLMPESFQDEYGATASVAWRSGLGFRRGRVAWRSTRGLVRSKNEDNATLIASEYGLFFGVYDGLGGPPAGDEASLTTSVHAELYAGDLRYLRAQCEPDGPTEPARLRPWLLEMGTSVNAAVWREAQTPGKRGMGTTMTVGAIVDDHLGILHAGDSRAYLLRGGVLRQLTRDRTMVQGLIESDVGKGMPLNEARSKAAASGWDHVVVQAVGIDEQIEFDCVYEKLLLGDVLAFTTDGVHGEVDAQQLARAAAAGGADAACREVLKLVLGAGAKDNATVAVVAFDGWGAA